MLQQIRTTCTGCDKHMQIDKHTNRLTDTHTKRKLSMYKRQHPDIRIISISAIQSTVCALRKGHNPGVEPKYKRE